MDQMSFGDGEYASKRKRTRRETFLAEMEQMIPWTILLNLTEPFYPKAGNGRPPYPLKVMLKVQLMQNWFGLSDPAMEESLYEIASMRQFAGVSEYRFELIAAPPMAPRKLTRASPAAVPTGAIR